MELKKQIVINITKSLYEELESLIEERGVNKSFAYENRMKYGLTCAQLNCNHFMGVYGECKKLLKENKGNTIKVCLHVTNKTYSVLKDLSENRSLSCVCFATMMINDCCKHLCEDGICIRSSE